MDKFRTERGAVLDLGANHDQLRIEHVLQRDRDVWKLAPAWPYLVIDEDLLRARLPGLITFPVFSCAQLWQNFRGMDLGTRLIGSLAGSGTDAGLGANSRAFVAGKANAKANFLLNWNPPLTVGSTPWCAEGTHFIYVDGEDRFQHKFGELTTVNTTSRTSSPHFDFTTLSDLRDRFNADYLNGPRDGSADLDALSALLDRSFEQNALSIRAANAHHASLRGSLTSTDYEAPVLTRYDRTTHDTAGQPKIEVSFALLHYEKAIIEFNAMKKRLAADCLDEAFAHGVYCAVAVAACIEAIANGLAHVQTATHPDYRDKRPPLTKINAAASAIATSSGSTHAPLLPGQAAYDVLDRVRVLRNGFMHAKELENDIDPEALTSTVLAAVDEDHCRSYLAALRAAVDHVFAQLPSLRCPIVTKPNIRWMEDLEVP
ncbi:hypothetical protein [Xanthomonas phaseoli]|uniref:hypothetical protein n=2 Tax=Xanthomonas phaseoli TaxID=1985254 RepID=UPI000A5E3E62|nr:hypothetical protein [Xanthomonas phaseoli]UZB30552.1 hypothetical protein OM951_08730 [Xanthomonas phaseoli pv. phaseoli]